ncbi:hypothetical protein C8R45DRAFT_937363 [Mycena sanguinolenta]|nr:hypothetical protein C8R45DRAFT_937363 [Mycena sanguinolenta]
MCGTSLLDTRDRRPREIAYYFESHSSLATARSQSGVAGETPEGIPTTLTWKFRTLYPFAGDSRVHNQDQGSRTETETKSESRDQDWEFIALCSSSSVGNR